MLALRFKVCPIAFAYQPSIFTTTGFRYWGETEKHSVPNLGQFNLHKQWRFLGALSTLFRPQFSRENINDLEATERACEALI